jgi:hypothetical protein
MCQFASAFLKPVAAVPVRVADLTSHSETARLLGLVDGPAPNEWREWHYPPSGRIEVRVCEGDTLDAAECVAKLRRRWPRFADFFTWAQRQPDFVCPDYVDLDGLTSAEGLILPESAKAVSLNSMTSAEGLILPEGAKAVRLNGLTSVGGLVLPEGVETVWLDGLTSAEGLVLPEGVEWVGLSGLTSAEGGGTQCNAYAARGCWRSASNPARSTPSRPKTASGGFPGRPRTATKQRRSNHVSICQRVFETRCRGPRPGRRPHQP